MINQSEFVISLFMILQALSSSFQMLFIDGNILLNKDYVIVTGVKSLVYFISEGLIGLNRYLTLVGCLWNISVVWV